MWSLFAVVWYDMIVVTAATTATAAALRSEVTLLLISLII
jgi:hypothetical protein